MKHKIIKTDNYLLVVDESEITKGDWHLANDVMITKSHLIDENCKKIIAHLPLNGSPILEGVDLLPPLGDEVEKMAFEKFSNENPTTFATRAIWVDGYNKAKEKYKYTEEDLRKTITVGYDWSYRKHIPSNYQIDDFIQSLSQPKMPIGFKCVTQKLFKHNEFMEREFYDSILTTTTPEGHTEWVGTYIY